MRNIEVEYDYLQSIHEELTKVFIQYQWNLDKPFPTNWEGNPIDLMELQYRSDPLFHAKVVNLVSGVLHVVQKHV
jgi:hypothetical protein